MSTDWQTVRIGDLGKVITGKTPSTAISENFGGPYPFITIPDLDDRREITTSARTLSELGAHAMRSCRLPSDAVMMSCIATVGKCGITTKESFTNQQINSLICKDGIDPRFVYYSFTQLGKALEAAGGGGSVYTNVSKSRFEAIEIRLPPLKEQRSIAEMLARLDDKIALNHRINQTLEAMAQAIFKSWFVDFDPVKAKIAAIEQGEDPLRAAMCAISGKTDAELDQMPREHHNQLAASAALFPDAMEESELGSIPKGWSFRQIAQFGEVVCGKTPAKSNPGYFGLGTPFIKIPDMHNNVYVTQPSEQLTVQGVASQPKKTIPPGSICVSCIATVGKVILVHQPSQTNQQINSIIPRRLEYSFYLYFQMLEKQQVFFDLASGGSATLNMNTSIFSKVETLLPEDGVIIKFSELISPVFSQILANQKQADNLAEIRDSLLPKLLSGELRIPDTERILEEVWP
ncbi:restriction endonuclease subunit S [Thauera sp. Sel9]|uniref:restriction endonuclease subunit S n=1 Tax=Thauera sp. Sel9 TaxID=2974299 RepID=UPI0021E19942|nr:restriction endonuclease subunit S [Thauera sp. Sel9]MCV2217679.1 restriction endonuclease subunit S [Thauera sp. Sel9]